MNNPFKYTDPSGNSWISDAFNWIGQNWKTILTTVVTVGVALGVGVLTGGMGLVAAGFFAGSAAGLTNGVLGAALNGGSFRDCLAAGGKGLILGAFAGTIGGIAAALSPAGIVWGALYGAATGGVIGGVSSVMNGGDFWQGTAIGAGLGLVGGGIAGGQKALANGQNAWWGTEIKRSTLDPLPAHSPIGIKTDAIKNPDTEILNNQIEQSNDVTNSTLNRSDCDAIRFEKSPVPPRTINGMTDHLPIQATARGFSPEDIIKIVESGDMTDAMGRFGSQIRYTLGNNTVVVDKFGTIITVFSNAPAVNGLPKGYFIPF